MKSKIHKYVPVATDDLFLLFCFFKKTKYLNADKDFFIFFCQ